MQKPQHTDGITLLSDELEESNTFVTDEFRKILEKIKRGEQNIGKDLEELLSQEQQFSVNLALVQKAIDILCIRMNDIEKMQIANILYSKYMENQPEHDPHAILEVFTTIATSTSDKQLKKACLDKLRSLSEEFPVSASIRNAVEKLIFSAGRPGAGDRHPSTGSG